jgi:hypothetical protein
MNEEDKKLIDSLSYSELLQKWRHDPSGTPLFTGETGKYFKKVMFEKKEKLSHEEQVAASKSVGWRDISF